MTKEQKEQVAIRIANKWEKKYNGGCMTEVDCESFMNECRMFGLSIFTVFSMMYDECKI